MKTAYVVELETQAEIIDHQTVVYSILDAMLRQKAECGITSEEDIATVTDVRVF